MKSQFFELKSQFSLLVFRQAASALVMFFWREFRCFSAASGSDMLSWGGSKRGEFTTKQEISWGLSAKIADVATFTFHLGVQVKPGLVSMSQGFTSPNYWGYHLQQIFGFVMETKSPIVGTSIPSPVKDLMIFLQIAGEANQHWTPCKPSVYHPLLSSLDGCTASDFANRKEIVADDTDISCVFV